MSDLSCLHSSFPLHNLQPAPKRRRRKIREWTYYYYSYLLRGMNERKYYNKKSSKSFPANRKEGRMEREEEDADERKVRTDERERKKGKGRKVSRRGENSSLSPFLLGRQSRVSRSFASSASRRHSSSPSSSPSLHIFHLQTLWLQKNSFSYLI